MNDNFCEGVKLLLARAETHPLEFAGIQLPPSEVRMLGSRWEGTIGRYWNYMTSEEQQAVRDAVTKASRSELAGIVMKTLFDADQRDLFGEEVQARIGGQVVYNAAQGKVGAAR